MTASGSSQLPPSGQGSSPLPLPQDAQLPGSIPSQRPEIKSPSNPKRPKLSFNDREYEVIIKHHGETKDPSPDVSDQFTTLLSITLGYGIAALKHQHNLSEKDIKLKYITIKKKLNGDLFLTYKDKETKYKAQITNDLDINVEDKDRIGKTAIEKAVDTAYKAHETAMKLLEGEIVMTSNENSQIKTHELTIPAKLSENAMKFLNQHENIIVKGLKSKSSASKPREDSKDEAKKPEQKTPPTEKHLSGNASSDEPIKDLDNNDENEPLEEDPQDTQLPSLSTTTTTTSSAAAASSASASEASKALLEPPKEEDIEQPLQLTAKETDCLSGVRYEPTYKPIRNNQGIDEYVGGNPNSAFSMYLLKGLLAHKKGFYQGLKAILITPPILSTPFKPTEFSKEEIEKIFNEIINNTSLPKKAFLTKFSNKDKIFLKRILLQFIASQHYNDKEHTIQKHLQMIILEMELFKPMDEENEQALTREAIVGMSKKIPENLQALIEIYNELVGQIFPKPKTSEK
ncbi:MAG: hypothetical protein K1060chlam1_01193 [Candidatus Anoxychlamydiales bacterium]|nr:hypothetical protein [Candidatus Anoxychlamydiales bacterium]